MQPFLTYQLYHTAVTMETLVLFGIIYTYVVSIVRMHFQDVFSLICLQRSSSSSKALLVNVAMGTDQRLVLFSPWFCVCHLRT